MNPINVSGILTYKHTERHNHTTSDTQAHRKTHTITQVRHASTRADTHRYTQSTHLKNEQTPYLIPFCRPICKSGPLLPGDECLGGVVLAKGDRQDGVVALDTQITDKDIRVFDYDLPHIVYLPDTLSLAAHGV